MVTNTIVTRSGKTLDNDMKLDDDLDKRQNNEKTNVKKRTSDNDLKPYEVILESSKVKESQIISMTPITIPPSFPQQLNKKGK